MTDDAALAHEEARDRFLKCRCTETDGTRMPKDCPTHSRDLLGLRVYVAGPMSGLADHNFPMFDAAEDALRRYNVKFVISPANITRHQYGGLTTLSPRDYVRSDLLMMVERCDAICLLPGWEKSTGAKAEVAVALVLGFVFLEYIPPRSPGDHPHVWAMQNPPTEVTVHDGYKTDPRLAAANPSV